MSPCKPGPLNLTSPNVESGAKLQGEADQSRKQNFMEM